jgi:hypothetical protein
MPQIKIPPMNEKLLNSDGTLKKPWHRFFELMQYYANLTANEDVTGKWQLRQKPNLTFTNEDGTLTRADFGKTILFDTQGSDVVCSLPAGTSQDIDGSFQIIRKGIGRLLIKAAGSDQIETSKRGVVYCNERNRVVANIGLYLAEETKWGIINGTGIWKIV